MNSRADEQKTTNWILLVSGLIALAFVLNGVLLVLVLWKEDPLFWRNEGGYPIWLRDLNLDLFYPILLLQAVILGALSACQVFANSVDRSIRVAVLIAVLILWLIFFAIGLILIWNNAENILDGRDLHYHPY